jgi:hypothetical protein
MSRSALAPLVALATVLAVVGGACSSSNESTSRPRGFCKAARNADLLDPLDMESFGRTSGQFRALARVAPEQLEADIKVMRRFIDGALADDGFTDRVEYLHDRVAVATKHLARVVERECNLDLYDMGS